jgi:hypothetical protein
MAKSIYQRGFKCHLTDEAFEMQKAVGAAVAPLLAKAKDKEIMVIQAAAVDAVCMAGCQERIRRLGLKYSHQLSKLSARSRK